nr:uncharacterized protein LOC109182314 [Ipomoea trifida]
MGKTETWNDSKRSKPVDVTETCLNGSKIYAGGRADRRSNAEKKSSDLNGFNGNPLEDVNEELKKALKSSTSA